MINILLCEQDSKWITSFEEKFSTQGTLEVTNYGNQAKDSVNSDTKFDVLIVNLETKTCSFFELVRYIKHKSPKTHILLIVNEDVKIEEYFYSQKEVAKLGINKLFKKPFNMDTLTSYIDKNFKHYSWRNVLEHQEEKDEKGSSPESEQSILDKNFTSLKYDQFQHNNICIFDLYLKLSKNKYLKIFHEGEKMDFVRIARYLKTDPNLRLYFKLADRLSYVDYVNLLLERKLKKTDKPTIKMIKSVESTSKLIVQEIFTKGLEPTVVEQSNLVCKNIYKSIQRNMDLKVLLKDFIQEDNSFEAHVFLTAFYTAIISDNVEWITEHSRSKLLFGAMLHDIGKLKLPKDIRAKAIEDLNKSELLEYKKHPEYGVEMLDSIEGISEQIKQIVYQHHELNNGEGYPNKLLGLKIYPLAKIVSFANFLANKSLNFQLSPFDTIRKVIEERDEIMFYEPFVVKAFIKGFVKNVQ